MALMSSREPLLVNEVAFYDVGVGFVALLVGIFVGGILYARLGMKRAVLLSLILMAVSNLSFAALASIAGRFLTGTTVGALIDAIGYVNFYLLTTLVALPGVILFWFMIRSGLADLSIGSAGREDR